MRLTCIQRDLLAALNIVSKAVGANSTLPILNNVVLNAQGKRLFLAGTNLEVAIKYSIETEILNEGGVTLPARLLTQYVGCLSRDEKVEISSENGGVQLATSDSSAKIKGLPLSEFPPIPAVEKESSMTVSCSRLRLAIQQVAFAAALNTTRPILGGVYLRAVEGKLVMAATDSYRLSEKSLSVSDVTGNIDCILPARTLLELSSILDSIDPEAGVEIVLSKNQAMFLVGNLQMTTRLIEGQFPNYRQILPKNAETKATLSVLQLSAALKRINLFARENNNKVILSAKENALVLTTEGTQHGEGVVQLASTTQGPASQVALNSQFLLDALSHLPSEEVLLEIGQPSSPVKVCPSKSDDYIHIIMPLKL